ncbi:MAG: dienelactone hydrolase family protein [Ruminococcus sp.]|nr:dienelactone hydrolase family protein [Ruminococcus sp.]
MKWAIRELLNPVTTRSLLYGADPFDLEYILRKLDGINVRSGRQIQELWLGEWQKKLERYSGLRDKAEKAGNKVSAAEYARMAVQCHYARFMINIEDPEHKTEIYGGLAESYRRFTELRGKRSEYTEIDTEYGKLPAYIHYPGGGNTESFPAAITYSGIGSCKEELEMLAAPLTERGIAVIAPDMPGAGGALIYNNIKCGGRQLEAAFEGIYRFIESRPELNGDRLANFGLCMGGGYAFRATVKNPGIRACVSLFPLLMNFADQDSIPLWMKRGKWSSYQYGEDYLEGMKVLEEGTHNADFLMVYSDDDNWMSPEASQRLIDKATGHKECIRIEDKPAYVSEETIMHSMPVGEQYHWIKHIAADFIAERLNG